MDQELAHRPRHAAPERPEASEEAPPESEYEAGHAAVSTSASAVTPGARIGASSAAVLATATTGPATTSAMRTASERPSRVVRIPRLPRLRPQRFIIPVALGLTTWLLVVALVGAHGMHVALSGTDWVAVAGALVVAQVATVGQGLALWGGVTTFIPPGVLVRSACAISFAGLIGGPVGSMATAVSVHRQRGMAPGIAYSSGLLSTAAGVTVPLLLGLGFVPVAARELRFESVGPAGSTSLQVLLLFVVGAGLIGGLAFIVPRVRHAWASRSRPQFASAWANVYEVTAHVGPVGRLLAGPALTQLVLAAALGWCLHAVGASANFGALMLVCCTATVLGGITPVPGGMGLVEATYISGLTLAGVPQDLAAGATLLFRTCTAYVPALWGWLAFARLRESEDNPA